MRPVWNRLLLPYCGRDCCCDLVGAHELGLPVAVHPWGDESLRLPSSFDFADLDVDDDDGLQEYDLLEV